MRRWKGFRNTLVLTTDSLIKLWFIPLFLSLPPSNQSISQFFFQAKIKYTSFLSSPLRSLPFRFLSRPDDTRPCNKLLLLTAHYVSTITQFATLFRAITYGTLNRRRGSLLSLAKSPTRCICAGEYAGRAKKWGGLLTGCVPERGKGNSRIPK